MNPMQLVIWEQGCKEKKKKLSKQNNAARQLGYAGVTLSQLACSNLELN